MIKSLPRLTMNHINLNLEYCYGIKRLKTTLDFSNKSMTVLYAQNGVMKTSLAETFAAVSIGGCPSDRIVPSHSTVCEITDENGQPLTKGSIFVIRPMDESFRPGEAVSLLLVNAEMSREYSQIVGERDKAQAALLDAVKRTSKSKRPLDREISLVIMQREDEFLRAVVRIREELLNLIDTPFADVDYDQLFDPKGLEVLAGKDIAAEINGYFERYNKLLGQSLYFKKGTFDYYNAGKIAKALVDNGFFDAAHSLNLISPSEIKEIKSAKELEDVIEKEKQMILSDGKLKAAFEKVSKALTKNDGLRDFQAYLMNHEDYLSQIGNVNVFKENVLKSYLKVHYDLYVDLLDKHDKVAERERVIRQQAINEKTLWSELIETFNSRFFVPFRLVVQNPVDVQLGREGVKLGFTYKDPPNPDVPMEEGLLLKCLSQGERRAYYLLQVLFEVAIRRKNNTETLFVIDDIADSFDYQNKYAILHYLIELGEDPLFHQLIMTHNFDFFRSVIGRARVRENAFVAEKTSEGITLREPEGINNPFVNIWKRDFFAEDLKKIASICFIRNLIEYTKGHTDEFKTLTSLLHCKPDSRGITVAKLDAIFSEVCGVQGSSSHPDRIVIDVILEMADKAVALPNQVGLEHKIVLSIASRLVAERYMISEINDASFTDNIKSYQTQVLLTKYRSLFPASAALRVLDRVALMTPENIHLNSFMFEPLIDMSDTHLRELYADVCKLK